MSISQAAGRLSVLCDTLPQLLRSIPDELFNHKPSPGKWSIKEVLGHLIDSAANNHQRFIRIQYEHEPVIYYDQDQWNMLNQYSACDKEDLIGLWMHYNRHLTVVIRSMPPENLVRHGISKDGNKATLEWYVTDYVAHLEHHISQMGV